MNNKNDDHNNQGFLKPKLFWRNDLFQILLLAVILGIICGFLMVIFNFLLIIFEFGFKFIPFFLGPIIASFLTSIIVKYLDVYEILGTGSSEFIKEIHSPSISRKKLKILITKASATSWTYGSGIICGREGPGLLIGSNIGSLLSKYFLQNKDDCSFIGASACTAAILKAPISGALFCAELPYNNYIQYKSLLPSIIASSIAYFIFCFFFGFDKLIEPKIIPINPEFIQYLILFPLLVIFGIFTGLFVFVYIHFLRNFMVKIEKKLKEKNRLWLTPSIGGFCYGIFLLFSIPLLSNPIASDLTHPDISFLSYLIASIQYINLIILILLLIFILIAIFLSIGSLNSAGVIMPLMFYGGLLGAIFGIIFYPENPDLFILLGISGVLGSATKNPIAAIFIIVEMTWTPLLFIPAGIATIIAYIFSGPNSIIQGQKNA